MIKCLYCGSVFDEDEIVHSKQWLTDNYYEIVGLCPNCDHDELADAYRCLICEEYFCEEELTDGLCSECSQELIERYRHDIYGCMRVCQDDKEDVEINAFLAAMYTTQQIEELLFQNLIESNEQIPVDCLPYIQKYNFIEHVLDEENEGGE